jgi:hypothetical protein
MSYQYKLHKYLQKNKLLIGAGDTNFSLEKQRYLNDFLSLYNDIIKNPDSVTKDIAVLLYYLVSRHTWLHIPSIKDIGYDIFNVKQNNFNVTTFWHEDLRPHDMMGSQTQIHFDCPGCGKQSKLDQRISSENEYVRHHVDQHLYRISTEYLYTYNLVTCSALILIQDGYVGMMHIDAGNTYDDITEFIREFELKVGSFTSTLKIHGFFHNEIYDKINKFLLIPLYGLIVTQHTNYGNVIFDNILINFPSSLTDKPYISQSLYIFAFPSGDIKGFYVDIHSNVLRYDFFKHFVKIYEQQLTSPEIIANRLTKVMSSDFLTELITYIGTTISLTEENLTDVLSYVIAPDTTRIDEILILKDFLEYYRLNPDHFLLEKN